MNFDLKGPCPECPFSTLPGAVRLKPARVREIVRAILAQDASFPCHKTVVFSDDDDEAQVTGRSQHCAGAAIFLERRNRPNQWMRIAERLGLYDRGRYGDLDAQPVVTATSQMETPRHEQTK